MTDSGSSPIPLRIRLPYGTEDEFIERYGTNVARGGIFIATRSIKPEGTLLQFEFVLGDGARLLRGEGVVVKTQVDEGGGRSGMTVRFTRLDARSKALVDRVIAHRSGATEAESPPPPPAPEPSETDAAASEAAASPEVPATSPKPAAPEPKPAESEPDLNAREQAPPPSEPSAPTRLVARRITLPETPAVQPADEVVLGIDLGTTNSRAAVYIDGAAKVVPLTSDGKSLSIPSVVAVDEKDRVLVGIPARAQLLVNPANTVFGSKRLTGRRARSQIVKQLAEHFPWPMVADAEGDAAVQLRGKTWSLPEIASRLISTLKDSAQELVGREIKRAVLCVPAYFNDHQRNAVLQAGRLAGLEVMRIFNEPSAVALAYGYGRGLARKRVLVYDLGGGTFDVSVVEITGDDLEVVATGGDNFLGGVDFDARVADELSRSIGAGTDPGSPDARQRIRDAAEQAKIALSEVETTPVHVPFASTQPDGAPAELRTELTRDTLERLTSDLVDRTIATTHSVLQAANLTAQSIDEVLLVGGQSLAPLVHRRMEETLRRPTRWEVDAHSAVAIGAAILGHALVRQEKGKSGVAVSEILSLPIGIGMKGGSMRRVLDRNTRLPVEKTLTFPAKSGVPLAIPVFQGDATMAEDNEYLGCLQLTPERAGDANVRFQLNADGLLRVTAQGPGSREEILLATTDASDEVRRALWANAPEPTESGPPPARESGLLGGIRRLFGKR